MERLVLDSADFSEPTLETAPRCATRSPVNRPSTSSPAGATVKWWPSSCVSLLTLSRLVSSSCPSATASRASLRSSSGCTTRAFARLNRRYVLEADCCQVSLRERGEVLRRGEKRREEERRGEQSMSSPSPSHHHHHRSHIGSRGHPRTGECGQSLQPFNIGDVQDKVYSIFSRQQTYVSEFFGLGA